MWFELWDSGSRNRVGAYNHRREALLSVAREVEEHGAESDAVATLVLIPKDDNDKEVVIHAPDLARLAIEERDTWISLISDDGDRWLRFSAHNLEWTLLRSKHPVMWRVHAEMPDGGIFRAWTTAIPPEAVALAQHWADLTIEAWLQIHPALL